MLKLLRQYIYKLSKKASNITGLDIPYFVENSFWTFTNQFINLVIGFLLYIVFANYLSKELFGQYNLVLSFVAVFTVFSFPGLNAAIARSVAKGMTGSYIPSVKYSFKWSLLGSVSLIIVAIWYVFATSYELALSLFIAAIFFPIIQSFSKWNAFFMGQSKFEIMAKYSVIQNVTIFSISTLIVFTFNNSVLYILAAYFILTALFNYLWHSKATTKISDNIIDNDCIPYGKFMTKASLINMLVLHFDKIIVGLLNIKLLAVFAIALKLIESIKTLIKSVYSVSFPKFASQKVSIKFKHIIVLMFAGLLFAIALYIVSEFLIVYFFGNKYIESAYIFNKLIFITPFVAVSALLNIKVNAEKRKNKILLVNTVVPISSLIISLITFIITNNLEYFVIAKVYTTQIAYFLILVPEYNRHFFFSSK